MECKYFLQDDLTGLKIGYFDIWPDFKVEGRCRELNVITLEIKRFFFANEFLNHLMSSKEALCRLIYIGFYNKSEQVIAQYPFEVHRTNFDRQKIEINNVLLLVGRTFRKIDPIEFEILHDWINRDIEELDRWVSYDARGKRAWLHIANERSKSLRTNSNHEGKLIFEIDGSKIVDYNSFFCSIGETINGPMGYFGMDLYTLKDCLSGGYGVKKGFLLKWENYEFSKIHLDQNCWEFEIEERKKDYFEEPIYTEIPSMSFFEALLKLFHSEGIHLILET